MSRMDQAQMAFDYAVAARKHEIDLLWQRSLFFWGLVSAIFIARFVDARDPGPYSEFFNPVLSWAGFMLSCALYCSTRGGKWWQDAWEEIVEDLGAQIGIRIFEQSNSIKLTRKKSLHGIRFSQSQIAIAVSILLGLCWLTILAADLAILAQLEFLEILNEIGGRSGIAAILFFSAAAGVCVIYYNSKRGLKNCG